MSSTTVLIDRRTRDALARCREAFHERSLDAVIQRLLREATPSATDLWGRHKAAAERIVRRHGAKRLIAFGSRVRDDRHPGSDLDLVVEMPVEGGVAALFALRDDLSEALAVRVDLGDMPPPGSRLHERLKQEGVPLVGPPP